jgi:hypothetical protein
MPTNITGKIFPINRKHVLIAALSLQLASACAPVPIGLTRDPPGPPEFVEGYHDGCDSGLAAFGNSYYKAFYHFTKRFDVVNDGLYQNGWEKGYQYCRQYAMKWTHKPL